MAERCGQLAHLGRKAYVSQSGLAHLLSELKCIGKLPDQLSRNSIKRARDLDIKKTTAYGDILQTLTIQTDTDTTVDIDYIHPGSFLAYAALHCDPFSEMDLVGENLEVVFIPRLGKKGLDDMLPIIGTPIQWLLDIVKGAFIPLVLNGTFHKPEISVKPGYNIAAPIRNLIQSKSK